jgi:hypothetical protein
LNRLGESWQNVFNRRVSKSSLTTMKSTGNPNLPELEIIQLEAAKLRQPERIPERSKHSGTARGDVSHVLENTDEYNHEDQGLNPDTRPENRIHEWGAQLEALATELEAAAIAHPRLALLAAFGLGVVAGQLLSRKQD